MRLWSLHPRLLDAKGLVAVWREGLLAQAVLSGRTRGYTHHPQLERFRNHQRPLTAIRAYLHFVCDEAESRGYSFGRSKLGRKVLVTPIRVNDGQVRYEFEHLKKKLRMRDRAWLKRISGIPRPECHPLFVVVSGGIESWERR